MITRKKKKTMRKKKKKKGTRLKAKMIAGEANDLYASDTCTWLDTS
jgi:hypothetical protein